MHKINSYPNWNFCLNAENTPDRSLSFGATSFACIGGGTIRWPFDIFISICKSAMRRIVINTRDTPRPTAKRSLSFIDLIRPIFTISCFPLIQIIFADTVAPCPKYVNWKAMRLLSNYSLQIVSPSFCMLYSVEASIFGYEIFWNWGTLQRQNYYSILCISRMKSI